MIKHKNLNEAQAYNALMNFKSRFFSVKPISLLPITSGHQKLIRDPAVLLRCDQFTHYIDTHKYREALQIAQDFDKGMQIQYERDCFAGHTSRLLRMK